MSRRDTRYVAPPPMADSIWIQARAALTRLRECHDKHADCHPSNHTKWEAVALFRLEEGIVQAIAQAEELRAVGLSRRRDQNA